MTVKLEDRCESKPSCRFSTMSPLFFARVCACGVPRAHIRARLPLLPSASHAFVRRFAAPPPQPPPPQRLRATDRYRRWWIAIGAAFGVGTAHFFYRQYYGAARPDVQPPPPPVPVSDTERRVILSLPLRAISRLWGWMHSIDLPVWLRESVYYTYASQFGCNLSEMEQQDIKAFRNLGEFFYRTLKPGARTVDPVADLVSPSDGRVLIFGEVTGDRVEQVKGMTYSLAHFLGGDSPAAARIAHTPADPLPAVAVPSTAPAKDVSREEKKSTGSWWSPSAWLSWVWGGASPSTRAPVPVGPTRLFHIVIYLAPGDYHRFHSPADWSPSLVRHYPGELLSVSPALTRVFPDLFALNERVVVSGDWKYGSLAYVAVGATNVGNIVINAVKDLKTNLPGRVVPGDKRDYPLGAMTLARGDEMGGFRLGSTVVLIFEAPSNFRFVVEEGQRLRMGQPLGTLAPPTAA